jgi:hypothetical protein
MVDPLSGDGRINPQTQQVYKQEFAEGAKLFQQSLQQYQNSNIPAQKEAFKDVMKKALNIMNETAQLCLSKEAQKKESKLNDDFANFDANDSAQNTKALDSSINSLNRSL